MSFLLKTAIIATSMAFSSVAFAANGKADQAGDLFGVSTTPSCTTLEDHIEQPKSCSLSTIFCADLSKLGVELKASTAGTAQQRRALKQSISDRKIALNC